MKKVAFVAILAASVLTSGLTAYFVQKSAEKTPAAEVVENSLKVPAHFTNNPKESYPDLTYAAETAVHAVVSIEKKEEVQMRSRGYGSYGGGYNPFFDFFGIPQQEQQREQELRPESRMRRSGGSGVIISADGYIVSNNHVTENADELVVTLYDGRVFDARIVGSDPSTDLSLIKIDAKDLPVIPIGNSEDLRLGEWVIAIGAPYELSSTITAGIISAKSRRLSVIEGGNGIESFLQTDAAVNPGNSGGALVNTRGELVGINSVIMSPTGTFTGYSFAVPSSIMKKVASDLKEYGVVQRALIGIEFYDITEAFLKTDNGKKTGIKESGGVYVSETTPDGAAQAAGIEVGDVITAIDGMKVGHGGYNLQEVVSQRRPGDKIKISLKRGTQTKQIEVVLRNIAGREELLEKATRDIRTALGGTFEELTERDKEEFNVQFGIKVASVSSESILAKAGIRKGYVITRINDRPMRSLADLNKITSEVESFEIVTPEGRTFRSYSMNK